MSDIAWIKQRPIAHRGYHDRNKTCWENSLSAFAAAVDKNFAIECDVHLSSDGVPVVFHDNDLKRLSCRRSGSAARAIMCRRSRKCWRWSPDACRW